MCPSIAFTGTLTLYDDDQEAWLAYRDAQGADQNDLMTREPKPPGTGPRGGIFAIWDRYASDPEIQDGDEVELEGYVVDQAGHQRILHVTRS